MREATRTLAQVTSEFSIDTRGLPILAIGDLLTFLLRGIFIVAGLAALIYGLWGGLAWITSGGEKDKVQAARDRIQAAIVGIFVLIIVLTIMWTLETVVFRRNICFGISCPINIPQLKITPLPGTGGSDGSLNQNNTNKNQANDGGSQPSMPVDSAILSQAPSGAQSLPNTGGN